MREFHSVFIAMHSLMYDGYSFLFTTAITIRVVLVEVLSSEAFNVDGGAA